MNDLEMDWVKLGAPQVPDLLTSMYSSSVSESEYVKAYEKLRSLVYPQGIADNWDWDGPRQMMQHDLPHQVTPFLIKILAETTSARKRYNLTDLLYQLANYGQYQDWVRDNAYLEWAHRLKEAVRRGKLVYEGLLNDPDPYLIKNVRDLLQSLEEG